MPKPDWWASPKLLGGVALGIVLVLSIIFVVAGGSVMSETPDTEAEAPQSAAAKLFDLRLLIGGLFIVYGVMLTVAGFFTSATELAKAAGININLWLGIGMLVLGVLFLPGGGSGRSGVKPPQPDATGTGR